MTFDMSLCKPGDKLKRRDGGKAVYVALSQIKKEYPHVIETEDSTGFYSYAQNGTWFMSEKDDSPADIIGFWPDEPEIKAPGEFWVNVYPYNINYIHRTLELAVSNKIHPRGKTAVYKFDRWVE